MSMHWRNGPFDIEVAAVSGCGWLTCGVFAGRPTWTLLVIVICHHLILLFSAQLILSFLTPYFLILFQQIFDFRPHITFSYLSSTRCHEDLQLSIFSQQACVKSLFKVLSEGQISLKPDLVGPDQSRSRFAEMLHGDQELVQEVVMVDHISCQHVVVVIHRCRIGVPQVIAPGQSSHLGCVPATAPGVSGQVHSQVAQDDRKICGCHPGTWGQLEKKSTNLL